MTLIRKLSLVLALSALGACSGGSGGGGSERQVDVSSGPSSGGFVYAGPAPASDEIQQFKQSFYDPLAANDRCGECHTPGGSGTTFFVNQDNVNDAWQAARTVVSLNDPAVSAVVRRVAEGHNCWLGVGQEEACATTVTGYVERWAAETVRTAATVQLLPRRALDPGGARVVPAALTDAVALYPALESSGELMGLLAEYCADCHSDTAPTPQVPYFASADASIAFEALRSRINLSQPQASRVVLRLYPELHNCWSNCEENAAELLSAVERFAAVIDATEVDPGLLISGAQVLAEDGIIATAGGRHESDLVAKWEFREGAGSTVADTSGVLPEIPLALSGEYSWMASWGLRMINARAQGGVAGSAKLFDQLVGTGEYSIEAWVAPANVSQEQAWIFGYSGGPDNSNLVLRQSLYNYEGLTRSSVTEQSNSGEPALATDDNAELAQATLQHVVLTYDPVAGRRLYVNGVYTGDVDSVGGGLLNNWNESFAVTLGNSTSGANPWAGALRLAAVHNRALSAAQVAQNFDVGVGQKYYLLFSVSELLDGEASCTRSSNREPVNYCYVVFEVSQFDDSAYLFSEPFFAHLNPDGGDVNFDLRGIRIGLNGRLVGVGQAFVNVTGRVSGGNLGALPELLSPMGTILALEYGAEQDEFFLAFDALAGRSGVADDGDVESWFPVYNGQPAPDVAIRTFDEINATLSALTGVPTGSNLVSQVTGKTVPETFGAVRRALPGIADFNAFMSSHQMAATQLAAAYCDALVQDGPRRAAVFPGLNVAAAVDSGIDWRGLVAAPLIDRAANAGLLDVDYRNAMLDEVELLISDSRDLKPYVLLNGSWVSDPNPAAHNKRDGLMFCENDAPCGPGKTAEVVKAACTAVFGSALVMIK
ncbi:LamG domain-containing protein [Halioglobus maricola]|uniref:LamG domain-containing protein n=1 Tax=Halioglobus maricola TaxID=2601894 RepID=A0A5P9NN25_9GAMM|nr:LamG domain-containing protein [Halioglobus maricola]QFU77221.1 LamG domain-containing protein [Halioglobus maricola]